MRLTCFIATVFDFSAMGAPAKRSRDAAMRSDKAVLAGSEEGQRQCAAKRRHHGTALGCAVSDLN
jgi:hypothetical protein